MASKQRLAVGCSHFAAGALLSIGAAYALGAWANRLGDYSEAGRVVSMLRQIA